MKIVLIILGIVVAFALLAYIAGIVILLKKRKKTKAIRKMMEELEELPEMQAWRRSQKFDADLTKAMRKTKGDFGKAIEILGERRGWYKKQKDTKGT